MESTIKELREKILKLSERGYNDHEIAEILKINKDAIPYLKVNLKIPPTNPRIIKMNRAIILYLNGFTIEEIALMLHTPTSTIKEWLVRSCIYNKRS